HADAVRDFSFPADHGPHQGFRSEWWYLTVMLSNDLGAEFGVQFTVFRQALEPASQSANPWRTPQVFMAHAALTAVREQRHWEAQRLARGHPRLAGASGAPFRVWVDGWELRGREGDFARQRLEVAADEFRVALDLDVVKAPVLQGDRGLSAKGPDQASYYYSVPRLSATGTIWVGEVAHQVEGSAWLDREWSTSVLSGEQVGWDWFALQLEDATEFMAFRLRRADGARDPYDHGLFVDAAGATETLGFEDFLLEPEIYWHDDQGVGWPLQWRLTVGDRLLRVRAAVPDQRMDTSIVYWEGLVGVFDDSGRRLGRGYMELTGYGT
ncbi:MAG: carotenoid 1,2-hydratase, partial [Gammaproteobacteria bacterium]|nr:carotenoid 1,2-hydratase [Gammaproteobacteria bacterium]